MSDYQTHEGKIKQVQHLEGETLEDVCKRIWVQNGKPSEEYCYDDFRHAFYDKYFSVNDRLWEILENKRIEHEDSFCKLTENEDGTISFYTTFYNGGACETEMIEWALEKLEKKK